MNKSDKMIDKLTNYRFNETALIMHEPTLGIEDDIADPRVQQYMMQNWWDLDLAKVIQRDAIKKIDNPELFFKQFTWNTPVFLGEKAPKTNHSELASIYKNQTLSWFQFGLLAHWTFIFKADPYMENLGQAVDVENSLGQNAWHVFAITMKKREFNHIEMIKVMARKSQADLFLKDKTGKSAIDIIEQNIKELARVDQPEMLIANEEVRSEMKKFVLNQNLNETLKIKEKLEKKGKI